MCVATFLIESETTTQLILSHLFGRDFLKNINMSANYNATFINRFTIKEQQSKGKNELHQLGKKSPENRVQTFVPGLMYNMANIKRLGAQKVKRCVFILRVISKDAFQKGDDFEKI